MKLGKVQEVQ